MDSQQILIALSLALYCSVIGEIYGTNMKNRQNTYKEILKAKLQDNSKWPTFERPDFLETLNKTADNAFEKGSIEGYLAAVLIYHQIVEQMVIVLCKSSDFLIQLSIYPFEYEEYDYRGKMFGLLLGKLKKSATIPETKSLIQQCQQFNNLRIRMVHKLTGKRSISDIKNQCKKAEKQFNIIYENFDVINDNYKLMFQDYRKDTVHMFDITYQSS